MTKSKSYDGPVVFVDGVHYPVKSGDADLSRPLRFDTATAAYRDADADEPLHNDVHHERLVELDEALGGE